MNEIKGFKVLILTGRVERSKKAMKLKERASTLSFNVSRETSAITCNNVKRWYSKFF